MKSRRLVYAAARVLFWLATAWAVLAGVFAHIAYDQLRMAGYTVEQSLWYAAWRWFLVAGLPEIGAVRLMDHAKKWMQKQWKQLDGPQGQTDKEQGQD